MVGVTDQERPGPSPVPWRFLSGGSVRAVLRLVDGKLADQAARNAARSLAQAAAARREQDLTVADLRWLERATAEPPAEQPVQAGG